jgi:hypothetical protein
VHTTRSNRVINGSILCRKPSLSPKLQHNLDPWRKEISLQKVDFLYSIMLYCNILPQSSSSPAIDRKSVQLSDIQ